MKIGLIIYGTLDTVSGGYLYDKRLVEYLISKGVSVRIFSQEPSGSYFAHFKDNFSRKIIEDIKNFLPDILLEDELNHPSLFLLNKTLKKQFKVPLISIVHHLRSNEDHFIISKALLMVLEKKYLKSVDGFVFNSNTTRESVEKLINRKKKYVTVYPGKDRITVKTTEEKIKKKCVTEKLKIIFIGNIIKRKGLYHLLKSLSGINHDLWELSIAGNPNIDKKYFLKIKRLVYWLKLEKNINFCGQLDDENLKNEIIKNHILAVPSYYEGFGIVYVEAMGAGLPVIAGNKGGAKEIINDKINGFLIKYGDIKKIRNSVYNLIQNRDILEKMSFNALISYYKMPAWNDSMQKIYEFLKVYNQDEIF